MEAIIGLLIAIVSIAGGFAVSFFAGKAKSKSEAKSQAADVKVAVAEKTAEVETEVLTKVNNVQTENNKVSNDSVANGLRDKYTRD